MTNCARNTQGKRSKPLVHETDNIMVNGKPITGRRCMLYVNVMKSDELFNVFKF